MRSLREFAEQQAESVQEAQREQFATLTLNTAVELTSAALQQVQATGSADEQAAALRDAMRVLFPEAVALVQRRAAGLHARELSLAARRRAWRPAPSSSAGRRQANASARLRSTGGPSVAAQSARRARRRPVARVSCRTSASFRLKYLDLETKTLQFESLDVKSFLIEDSGHVPRRRVTAITSTAGWRRSRRAARPVDLEVEGIVDRISGLQERFLRISDETLAEFGLSDGEWKALSTCARRGRPTGSSAGQLAKRAELSSGAMTNRLDRMEEAGLVRRLPDPDDRRAVQVELTDAGRRAWETRSASRPPRSRSSPRR